MRAWLAVGCDDSEPGVWDVLRVSWAVQSVVGLD